MTGMKNNQLLEFLESKYPNYSFSLKQSYSSLRNQMYDIIQLKDLQISIEDKKKLIQNIELNI